MGAPLNVSDWSDVPATQTRLYVLWEGAKQRTGDKGHHTWERYGGRGITMCEEWEHDFLEFAAWAFSQGYVEPADHKSLPGKQRVSVDRIDSNGNYEPSNCRLSNPKQQGNNTTKNKSITAWGETKTLSQWADDPRCVVSYKVLCKRIRQKVEPHRALSLPALAPVTCRAKGASKYVGVSWVGRLSRWQAKIRDKHIGVFKTEVEAARAYDRAARQQWGRTRLSTSRQNTSARSPWRRGAQELAKAA